MAPTSFQEGPEKALKSAGPKQLWHKAPRIDSAVCTSWMTSVASSPEGPEGHTH